MAVNDVHRLTVVGAIAGEPVLNTFHFREDVVGVGSLANALVNGFFTNVNIPWNAWASSAWSANSIIYQGVRPVTPTQVFAAALAGTIVQPTIPTQCAIILTRKTIVPGKRGRGRIFLGGAPQTGVVNDSMTVAQHNLTVTLAAAIFAAVVQGGWTFTPALWSRKYQSVEAIVSIPVNDIVKTRRSRAFGTRFHRRKRHTVGSI
jgi:hypothetical protein